MIVSVRESKARLSELMTRASEGEDVIITVRGQPTARLVPVNFSAGRVDMQKWADDRRKELPAQVFERENSSRAIFEELREDQF
ncbi:MAG TPA: type II toxin-antitoxin system prevent-host-death family antitoxin [Verrucomicrobiales bacterium]|jgi:prevent-host-death family protein|nr:type II toxin-antitoxin system prevent-host-death family antitoxin [Verrucomicrobiales bacterium]